MTVSHRGGPAASNRAARPADNGGIVDVCILVEGCYPYVPGGVSAWIDWLMRAEPHLTFRIVALWPRPPEPTPRYALPPNAVALDTLFLQDFGARPVRRLALPAGIDGLANALGRLTTQGGLSALAEVDAAIATLRTRTRLPEVFNSPVAWELVRRMYEAEMPHGSFLHYFWAWRAILGGLLATLEHPLPKARIYHAISTGYAGMLAARAGLETGRPVLLSEHGIYTNERRIELLMADWVADTVDKGHALADPRLDLRDMWVRAFEAFARTCYAASTRIVTLYEDNQRIQRVLGARPEQLQVIANGIDLARFEGLERAGATDRPTMALIGRVVPIKDVKTFIAAAGLLRRTVPDLEALVLGPTDEEPAYVAECQALVASLGLEATVTFTGAVDVARWLPRIHVAVLTSLSESQPLVLLEAGAARVPFVATNVGSCREIIEGRSDEQPRLGPGGLVTGLASPAQIAEAVSALLGDAARREACGDALRARVEAYYTSARAAAAYRDLYAEMAARPDRTAAHRGG